MRLSIKHIVIGGTIALLLVTVSAIQLSSFLSSQDALLGHARQIMSTIARDTIDRSERFLAPAEAVADLTQRLARPTSTFPLQ